MAIIIKEKLDGGCSRNLQDISYELNIALEREFQELIRSPSFQDLLGAEHEEHFFVMLFMRVAKKQLDSRFRVPFRIADYFLHSIEDRICGYYAPFYSKPDCFNMYFIFTLAYEGLALNIEIDYKFTEPYKDIYLCSLEERVSYFSRYIFKSKVKHVAYLPDENNRPIENLHDIKLMVNSKTVLFNQIIDKLQHTAKSEFSLFRKNNPDWVVAVLKDRSLNLIISTRKDLILRVTDHVLVKNYDFVPSEISIRFSRLKKDHIDKGTIIFPFIISIGNNVSLTCCIRLTSIEHIDDSHRSYNRRGVIQYWKSITESLEYDLLIEGAGDYDSSTFLISK